MPNLKLLSVNCIWDLAEHNAMTDLIYFRENFYCCFREGEKHAGGKNGCIRILKSPDAIHWTSAALLEKKGIDLRDPMLSQMPNGNLFLNMGGSTYKNDTLISLSSQVSFSPDGTTWSSIQEVPLPDEWLWRVTWEKNSGYAAAYRCSDMSDLKKPWFLTLFQTTNGIDFTKVSAMDIPGKPSETTLRFDTRGTCIALIRRTEEAAFGISESPYTHWKWFPIGSYFGGPNFLILPNGEMLGAGRIFVRQKGKQIPKTALCKLTLQSCTPKIILPSGGDTSYPGMVFLNNKLYISYYSSHHGKALIYLAIIGYYS